MWGREQALAGNPVRQQSMTRAVEQVTGTFQTEQAGCRRIGYGWFSGKDSPVVPRPAPVLPESSDDLRTEL